MNTARTMKRIEQGKTISASREWEALVTLAAEGKIESRRAGNGQLEYVHNGQPVRVSA